MICRPKLARSSWNRRPSHATPTASRPHRYQARRLAASARSQVVGAAVKALVGEIALGAGPEAKQGPQADPLQPGAHASKIETSRGGVTPPLADAPRQNSSTRYCLASFECCIPYPK